MSRLVVLALVACASLPAAADASVKITNGLQYGSGAVAQGKVPLKLDLYEPAGDRSARRPVVVVIHGGGFVQQTRKDAGIVRIARGLAERGIVAASIDYRLQPQSPRPSSRIAPLRAKLGDAPISDATAAAADDTLTAISYLRRSAGKRRLDVRRLGLIGSSAGAITADHVAYTLDDVGIARPKIAFVGSLWGGVLVPPGAQQLDRGEASLFAVHATADTRVPVTLSEELVARAKAQGVRSEFHKIAGGQHGYAPSKFFTADVGRGSTPYDRLLSFASRALR